MWICVVQIFWAIPSVIGASLALFDFIYAAKAACPGSLLMRVQHFLFVRSVCCMNALKKFKLFATFVVTVAWENGFLMFIYARYRNIISFLCVTPSLLLPRHFLSFYRYLELYAPCFLWANFNFANVWFTYLILMIPENVSDRFKAKSNAACEVDCAAFLHIEIWPT